MAGSSSSPFLGPARVGLWFPFHEFRRRTLCSLRAFFYSAGGPFFIVAFVFFWRLELPASLVDPIL